MDQNLLSKCAKGHKPSQQYLYDLYAPKLYAICLRYVADQDVAKDVLQESFIKIFESLSSYRSEGSFEGWMRRITINMALGFLRKDKERLSVDIEGLRLNGEVVDAEGEITANITAAEISQFIQELPDSFREGVNLYIIDGYSHKEIGEILNITEDNSKQRLRRGRKALQKRIIALYRIPNPDETSI